MAPDKGAVQPPPLPDLTQLRSLILDTSTWGMNEVEQHLAGSRGLVLKLWRATANRLYGGAAEWPPPRAGRLKRRAPPPPAGPPPTRGAPPPRGAQNAPRRQQPGGTTPDLVARAPRAAAAPGLP